MGHLWLQGLLGREEAGTACREERCQGPRETLCRQGRGLSPTQQGSTRQIWGCRRWTEEPFFESRTLDLEPWEVRASGERPAVLWDQTK